FGEAVGKIGSGATNNLGWSAGLRFEAPLDPSAYRTVVERRRAEYQKAVENEELVREQLSMLVNNRLANLRTLRGVLERTQDALEISDKKVAELIRQFKNGRINSTQYIQGYDDLRNIQKLYHQSLYAWEIEKAALRLDLGIFLQGLGIPEVDPAAPVK
ncbi:MAG: TolC family protein, partial [Rhodospirillales bacterium]|nr:TolC family protein [Rhodospirillales bacterium]